MASDRQQGVKQISKGQMTQAEPKGSLALIETAKINHL